MSNNNNCDTNEEDIKPKLDNGDVKTILEDFYGLKGCTVKELQGYDDLNYHCLPDSSDNSYIEKLWPYGYVLKIMNSFDSKMTELCEAQNGIMLFLRQNNIMSPVPVKNVFGEYYMKRNFPLKVADNKVQKNHIVRLLEFQPGIVLKNVPKSYPLFYSLGTFVSKLNNVLKGFHHPVYDTHRSIWHLHSVPELKPFTDVIENSKRRQLVENIIEKFCQIVLPLEKTFQKGIIHGDFNEHNVLMSKSEKGEWKVSAILDFGDSHQSFYLYELAVSLCYMMFECKRQNLDSITGAGYFLAGFLTTQSNLNFDYGVLKLCICARICQSLILGLKAFKLHPDNVYVLDSQAIGWSLLEELCEISDKKFEETCEPLVHFYKLEKFSANEK